MSLRRAPLLLAAVASAALVVGASGLVGAQGATVGWSNVGNQIQGWRYSPLTQINTNNVTQLKQAWRFNTNIGTGGIEGTPLVIGNTAYVTTGFNHVFALNATTGQELWAFDPKDGLEVACCGPDARGLAYHDGTLYMLTLDDRLIALDAATGAVKWQVYVASAKNGVAETAAPLYYDGNIYIGSSGSELGIRGFEEARSATTGKLKWIFYTVPARNKGWLKLNHGIGGGTVWNNPVINPQTGLLYIGTANPAPLFYGLNRPGPDHWTDAIVALNAATGKFVWAFSTVPHDMWDYDDSSNPVLFPTGDGGMGVGEAGKSGYWWEFTANNGQLLASPLCFVVCVHNTPPPLKGTVTVNSAGNVWSPSGYDPQTGDAIVEGQVAMIGLSASAKGDTYQQGKLVTYFGSNFHPLKKPATGTITAINVNNGTMDWQTKISSPSIGAPAETAGGLIFAANSEVGQFLALDAKTGKILWSNSPGSGIDAGAAVYEVNGKEYVLVGIGGGGIYPNRGALAKHPVYAFVAYSLPN